MGFSRADVTKHNRERHCGNTCPAGRTPWVVMTELIGHVAPTALVSLEYGFDYPENVKALAQVFPDLCLGPSDCSIFIDQKEKKNF